jgi:hypothetical protein
LDGFGMAFAVAITVAVAQRASVTTAGREDRALFILRCMHRLPE